jgi:uncharacterized membrane protein YqgA involved in biofilm formation
MSEAPAGNLVMHVAQRLFPGARGAMSDKCRYLLSAGIVPTTLRVITEINGTGGIMAVVASLNSCNIRTSAIVESPSMKCDTKDSLT